MPPLSLSIHQVLTWRFFRAMALSTHCSTQDLFWHEQIQSSWVGKNIHPSCKCHALWGGHVGPLGFLLKQVSPWANGCSPKPSVPPLLFLGVRGKVPLAASSVTVVAILPYCPSKWVHEPFSELKPFSSQGFQKETILEVTKLLDVHFPWTLFLQCYVET